MWATHAHADGCASTCAAAVWVNCLPALSPDFDTAPTSRTAGRKATMASTKVWEHGQLSLKDHFLAVDHGMATAMTRVGILGECVF